MIDSELNNIIQEEQEIRSDGQHCDFEIIDEEFLEDKFEEIDDDSTDYDTIY